MGYWENTTYIAHGHALAVAEAMAALLQAEGMRRMERPAQREPTRFDPMQYADAAENDLWAVAVFPGAPEWTIVKTAPLELLGERAPGASRMRLVELACRLGASGFQINLYDSSALVLVEADAEGSCLLSGYRPGSARNPDPLMFHAERLSEDRIEPRFEILPLQQVVEGCLSEGHGLRSLDNDRLAARLADALGGESSRWCDNATSVDLLLRHRPLPMRGGIELYFERPARNRAPIASSS